MTGTTARNAVELDIRGQICPSCLLIALQEVNARQDALRDGTEVLNILTDSRHATNTIPAAVGNMGYQVSVDKDGGFYIISVTKGE